MVDLALSANGRTSDYLRSSWTAAIITAASRTITAIMFRIGTVVGGKSGIIDI